MTADTDPVRARDLVQGADLERARQITARATESAERERIANLALDEQARSWAVVHPALRSIFPGVEWTFLHRVVGERGTVTALQVAVADKADPRFKLLVRSIDTEFVWVPQDTMGDKVPGDRAIGCRTLLQVHDAMEAQRRRFNEEMSRD